LPPRAAASVDRRFGVEVVQIVTGSPAQAAGLRHEDLILDVDGVAVEQPGDLQRLMISERIGRAVTIRVFRNGAVIEVVAHPVELSL
jgi:S1-C subfamily serine protease